MLGPSRFFFAYWVALLVGVFVLYPAARPLVSAGSVTVILLGALTFSAAAALAALSPKLETHAEVSVDGRNLIRFVKVGAMANLGAAVLALASHGFSLGEVLSAQGLLSTANSVSVARYSGESSSPFVPPLLGVGYGAALAGPFLRLSGAGPRWLLGAPLATSVVYSAVTTERLALLLSAAFTVGGLIAAHVLRTGSTPRLSRRAIAGGLAIALLAASAFVSIAFLRVGRVDGQVAEAVYAKQQLYAFGSVPAFSQWLEQTRYDDDPLLFGTASVAGVEYLTGQDREATRAYDEFSVVDTNGSRTNVYTVFRGLAMDFGSAGMFIILALLGFLFGRLHRATSRGSTRAAGALGAIYGVILLSNTMAVTTFTNVVLGLAIGAWVIGNARASEQPARQQTSYSAR